MKFISFIVSTILIVLINQHSTMGLPVNNTVMEESCSEGFKMIKGQCMPINSKLSGNNIESSSVPSNEMIIHEEKPVTQENIPKKIGACPEGMEHGENGICQEITLSETTEVTLESTTDLNNNPGGEENPKGCPEGTEPDEQGACQEIKPSNSTKIVTDPKVLLKEDGSCPDNYKMIDGRCLYIKVKVNLILYPSSLIYNDNIPNGIRSKNNNDGSIKLELVPVLSDNSCPEGTEYSSYGLCQKRIRPSSSNLVKIDGHCPNGFELINGKCTYKDSKIQNQSGFSTTTIRMSESTTLPSKSISVIKSTTETNNIELQSKVTSTPL